MKNYSMSSIAVLLVMTAAPALAEGRLLPAGTECRAENIDLRLDAASYLLDRADVEAIVLDRHELLDLREDLEACEQRECEAVGDADKSLLEILGWPVVISAVVVSIAGGVVIGFMIASETGR